MCQHRRSCVCRAAAERREYRGPRRAPVTVSTHTHTHGGSARRNEHLPLNATSCRQNAGVCLPFVGQFWSRAAVSTSSIKISSRDRRQRACTIHIACAARTGCIAMVMTSSSVVVLGREPSLSPKGSSENSPFLGDAISLDNDISDDFPISRRHRLGMPTDTRAKESPEAQ